MVVVLAADDNGSIIPGNLSRHLVPSQSLTEPRLTGRQAVAVGKKLASIVLVERHERSVVARSDSSRSHLRGGPNIVASSESRIADSGPRTGGCGRLLLSGSRNAA